MERRVKLAILGSDSSHVELLTNLINQSQGPVRVESIWGESPDEARRKATALGIARVANTPKDAIKESDGVLVLSRFMENHLELGQIALDCGIPVYIDKLLSASYSAAQEFAAKNKEKRFFSCSPYRFHPGVLALRDSIASSTRSANVTGPLVCRDLQGDPRFFEPYFYGIHLSECVDTILSTSWETVSISKAENGIDVKTKRHDGASMLCRFRADLPDEKITILHERMVFDLSNGIDEMYHGLSNAIVGFMAAGSHDQNDHGTSPVTIEGHLRSIRLIEQITGAL
jgi:hypothetical protein